MRRTGGRAALAAMLVFVLGAAPAAADVIDDHPAAASRGPGDGWVFARGADGTMLERHVEGGNWTAWSSLGGVATSGPGATAYGNSINVFTRSSDDAIWQRYFLDGKWSDWLSLGGIATSAPAALQRNGTQYVDLAVRGSDNAIHHRAFVPGQGWTPWASIGGGATSAPALNSQAPGILNVFVRGTNGEIYQKSWDGSQWWADWVSLGGNATSAPIAVTHQPNTVDLFVRGPERALWQRHWNGSAWTPWFQVDPAPIDSAPAAMSQGPGHVHLFARTGGELSEKLWDGSWRAWTAWGPAAPPAPPPPPPPPPPDGRIGLDAGIRCTPPGGRLAVNLKVKRRQGRRAARVRKVVFFVRGGPKRADRKRPYRVKLRLDRPAGSKGRVYARVHFKRRGEKRVRRKTVSRRFNMCG